MGVRKVLAERSDWGSCAERKRRLDSRSSALHVGGRWWAQWLTPSEEVRKTGVSSASPPRTPPPPPKPLMRGRAWDNPIPGRALLQLAGALWEVGKLVPRTHSPQHPLAHRRIEQGSRGYFSSPLTLFKGLWAKKATSRRVPGLRGGRGPSRLPTLPHSAKELTATATK